MEVSVGRAKKILSRLLKRVAAGEEVVITKWGKPVARTEPVHTWATITRFSEGRVRRTG
jgi:prevent-host-death family protein